ncbi:uncharacterized protein CLUP02_06358 [Colletotrichum lupini]|uniref:C2H2-type domain-containing protein n=1 Tax=Colletotrichum lupini TaxID=145971 RepID=A0A9Q8WEK7_9PEZI|nr:uncharacterized protein CLUP02_06358 [Colletotrichum lupini]UQC80873.1 hypothetical protein CLUP02_06358 [Colletotrichum lupini]
MRSDFSMFHQETTIEEENNDHTMTEEGVDEGELANRNRFPPGTSVFETRAGLQKWVASAPHQAKAERKILSIPPAVFHVARDFRRSYFAEAKTDRKANYLPFALMKDGRIVNIVPKRRLTPLRAYRQIVNAFWCVSSHLCASSGLSSTQDMCNGARDLSKTWIDTESETWRPRDAGPNRNFHLQNCTTRVMMLKSPALGTCSYVTSNMHPLPTSSTTVVDDDICCPHISHLASPRDNDNTRIACDATLHGHAHDRPGPTSASDCVARVTGPGTCPDVTLDARPLTGWSLVGRWAWQSLTPHVLPRLSGFWLDYHVPLKEKSSIESLTLEPRGAEECSRGVSPCRAAVFAALYDDTPRCYHNNFMTLVNIFKPAVHAPSAFLIWKSSGQAVVRVLLPVVRHHRASWWGPGCLASRRSIKMRTIDGPVVGAADVAAHAAWPRLVCTQSSRYFLRLGNTGGGAQCQEAIGGRWPRRDYQMSLIHARGKAKRTTNDKPLKGMMGWNSDHLVELQTCALSVFSNFWNFTLVFGSIILDLVSLRALSVTKEYRCGSLVVWSRAPLLPKSSICRLPKPTNGEPQFDVPIISNWLIFTPTCSNMLPTLRYQNQCQSLLANGPLLSDAPPRRVRQIQHVESALTLLKYRHGPAPCPNPEHSIPPPRAAISLIPRSLSESSNPDQTASGESSQPHITYLTEWPDSIPTLQPQLLVTKHQYLFEPHAGNFPAYSLTRSKHPYTPGLAVAFGSVNRLTVFNTSHPGKPSHSATVAFYLDTNIQPNLVDSCYCVLLGNTICYCESYSDQTTSSILKLDPVDDPPIPPPPIIGLLPCSPWRSPMALGVMECPLDTPCYSSETLSPTRSPLNPGNENESDKASDSGFSNGVATPAAAGIDISRLRFECRWQNCGKVFRRPSDLTNDKRLENLSSNFTHGEKIYETDIQSLISKHERYHIKEYLCDEANCDKAFATMKDLKRHKKTHETLDGDGAGGGYRCRVPGCRKAKTGHVYNRRDNFVRHLRTKHVGIEFDAREEFDVTY